MFSSAIPYDVEFVTIQSIVDKLPRPRRDYATRHMGRRLLSRRHQDQGRAAAQRAGPRQGLHRAPRRVHHRGGHTTFYNSYAFKLAGITRDTPNPYGGTYDRDETGALNGRVTDLATAPFAKVGNASPSRPTRKQKRVLDGVAFISQKFVQYGLTTVHHDEPGVLPPCSSSAPR